MKDLDAKAAANQYINITFAPSVTAESLMTQSEKLTQKYMEASTELQRMVEQAQAAFQAQYKINRKAGRIEYQRQVEKVRTLRRRVESLRGKAEEAALKVDAFNAQQMAKQAFYGASLVMQGGAILPSVQQAIDNAGNIVYNESNGGGIDANVGRGTQGEIYSGIDGREGILPGRSRGNSRLLLLNTSQKTYQVEAWLGFSRISRDANPPLLTISVSSGDDAIWSYFVAASRVVGLCQHRCRRLRHDAGFGVFHHLQRHIRIPDAALRCR